MKYKKLNFVLRWKFLSVYIDLLHKLILSQTSKFLPIHRTPFMMAIWLQTATPAQWLSGRVSVCDLEVAGSIPGRVIPKTLKMVLAALSLGAQH